MAQIRWTPQAADSPQYAQLFAIDVLRAIERPAIFPRSGRIVPELGNATIREIILGSYRIV